MNNATPFPTTEQERWLNQIFSLQSAGGSGVVLRKILDVERRIGRDPLELEVRRAGFRLLDCGGQVVIVCLRGSLRFLC